jgi:Fur family transcriptional regulator, ferric uptake regulator
MTKASLPELPAGVRSTAARRAVLRAVQSSPGRFTVAELYVRARRLHPPLGLATTYRTLELLRDTGSVRALPGDERASYVKCHPGHHHHLVCTSCGSVEETDLCSAPSEQELRRRHGFVPDSHEVDIYGRCARCA